MARTSRRARTVGEEPATGSDTRSAAAWRSSSPQRDPELVERLVLLDPAILIAAARRALRRRERAPRPPYASFDGGDRAALRGEPAPPRTPRELLERSSPTTSWLPTTAAGATATGRPPSSPPTARWRARRRRSAPSRRRRCSCSARLLPPVRPPARRHVAALGDLLEVVTRRRRSHSALGCVRRDGRAVELPHGVAASPGPGEPEVAPTTTYSSAIASTSSRIAEPLVELLARDRQRRADDDDVPVHEEVEAALQRSLRQPRDRLARGVERRRAARASRGPSTSSSPQKRPRPRTSPIDGCRSASAGSASARYGAVRGRVLDDPLLAERLDRRDRRGAGERVPAVGESAGEEAGPRSRS